MIEIKLRYVHIFYCTKLHLSQCSGSWVISIKDTNFKFQQPSAFVLVFHKNVHTKRCSSSKELSE
jgi:hypothetical protein